MTAAFGKKISALLVCSLFLFLSISSSQAAEAYKPVTLADIPKVDMAGFLAKVEENKGKVVVVNIFASWCPPCREEVPRLIAIRNKFPMDEVVILGVSVDVEPKAMVTFINNAQMNYPVLLAQGDFTEKAGVRAVPQLLVFDKQGELVENRLGLMDEDDLTKVLQDLTR